jgi:hypothetical protein
VMCAAHVNSLVGASKEIDLEVNIQEIKCMFMSPHLKS